MRSGSRGARASALAGREPVRCRGTDGRGAYRCADAPPPAADPDLTPPRCSDVGGRGRAHGGAWLGRICTMRPSEPVARFATHASTVVGSESALSDPEPSIASGSGPLFRPAEPIHGPSSMDVRMRQQLWWLSLVIPVLCIAVVISSVLLGGPALARELLVAGMTASAACGSWMAWRARCARLTARATAVGWFILTAGGCSAIIYHG